MGRKGTLEGHLRKVRGEYATRRDMMLKPLEELAPSGFRWNRSDGGYHIWCSLPDGVNAGALLARAPEKRWLCYPVMRSMRKMLSTWQGIDESAALSHEVRPLV